MTKIGRKGWLMEVKPAGTCKACFISNPLKFQLGYGKGATAAEAVAQALADVRAFAARYYVDAAQCPFTEADADHFASDEVKP